VVRDAAHEYGRGEEFDHLVEVGAITPAQFPRAPSLSVDIKCVDITTMGTVERVCEEGNPLMRGPRPTDPGVLERVERRIAEGRETFGIIRASEWEPGEAAAPPAFHHDYWECDMCSSMEKHSAECLPKWRALNADVDRIADDSHRLQGARITDDSFGPGKVQERIERMLKHYRERDEKLEDEATRDVAFTRGLATCDECGGSWGHIVTCSRVAFPEDAPRVFHGRPHSDTLVPDDEG
jgi:hypothetical protein